MTDQELTVRLLDVKGELLRIAGVLLDIRFSKTDIAHSGC